MIFGGFSQKRPMIDVWLGPKCPKSFSNRTENSTVSIRILTLKMNFTPHFIIRWKISHFVVTPENKPSKERSLNKSKAKKSNLTFSV